MENSLQHIKWRKKHVWGKYLGIFNKICAEIYIKKNHYNVNYASFWMVLLKSSTVYSFLLSENFVLEIYMTNYFSESFNQSITPVNQDVKKIAESTFLHFVLNKKERWKLQNNSGCFSVGKKAQLCQSREWRMKLLEAIMLLTVLCRPFNGKNKWKLWGVLSSYYRERQLCLLSTFLHFF